MSGFHGLVPTPDPEGVTLKHYRSMTPAQRNCLIHKIHVLLMNSTDKKIANKFSLVFPKLFVCFPPGWNVEMCNKQRSLLQTMYLTLGERWQTGPGYFTTLFTLHDDVINVKNLLMNFNRFSHNCDIAAVVKSWHESSHPDKYQVIQQAMMEALRYDWSVFTRGKFDLFDWVAKDRRYWDEFTKKKQFTSRRAHLCDNLKELLQEGHDMFFTCFPGYSMHNDLVHAALSSRPKRKSVHYDKDETPEDEYKAVLLSYVAEYGTIPDPQFDM